MRCEWIRNVVLFGERMIKGTAIAFEVTIAVPFYTAYYLI